MDPALLKEREAFLKRAKATPTVEKRKAKPGDGGHEKSAKKAKMKPPPPKPHNTVDYKMFQGSSQKNRLSVQRKIVDFLKSRHQSRMNDPLSLEEILDETNQLDTATKIKHSLSTEALLNNPKIAVVKEDGVNKFCFKPTFNIHDKKSLVKLLRNYDSHGKGGILLEDIEESLPNSSKVLEGLQDHIIYVTISDKKKVTSSKPQDKKQVLFYNDRSCRFNIDEEFRKLWRSVTVEGLDEQKIEEYLNKQGISSMDATGYRKVSSMPKRKKGKQKGKVFKKHNDHLDGVLQDYTENPPGK